MDGEWWHIAISVDWGYGLGCNYIETYRKRNKIRKPITEIKFVRELRPDEKLPEKPLIIYSDDKTIEDYFKKTKIRQISKKITKRICS